MLATSADEEAEVWGKTIQTLPSEQMRFVLNAAVDTLPHNANLQLWKKRESDTCPLCGERQTLIHVLNCCRVARDLRRYNQRHDLVLGEIADAIRQKLPPSAGFSVDLKDNYSFPLHIASTDLRPDIVWWEDNPKKLRLVELTVPFETGFKDAAERKEASYEDLVYRAKQAGYDSHLITIEVGSRGVPHMAGFCRLKQELGLTRTELSSLLSRVSHKAIEGSFGIWCSRNKVT